MGGILACATSRELLTHTCGFRGQFETQQASKTPLSATLVLRRKTRDREAFPFPAGLM